MIDDHQRELIVVVSFPELGCDAQIVETVVRHELIAPDLVPLFRRFDACRAERVDTQTDRRAPRHRILYELHLLAVVSEQKRTRAFETLLDRDLLIGFEFKVGTHGAVRPNDADHVGTCLLPQSEVKQWTRDWLFLYEQAGANLHLAADTERIDALIADSVSGARRH